MNKPTVDLLKIGITALKKQHNKEEKWYSTFKEMFDGHLVPQFAGDLEEAIVKMLEIAYNDKNGTISWWIYEQEFGQKCKEEPAMWDNNGPIPLRNIDELYNCLIKDGFGETESTNNVETQKTEKTQDLSEQQKKLKEMEDNITYLFELLLR